MFSIFNKKKSQSDKGAILVHTLADLLALQAKLGEKDHLDDGDSGVNLRAVGYLFGFCDCALQIAFGNRRDNSALTNDLESIRQVFKLLYGMRGDHYIDIGLSAMKGADPAFNEGMVKGGSEYRSWCNSVVNNEPNPLVPVGFSEYLLGREIKRG